MRSAPFVAAALVAAFAPIALGADGPLSPEVQLCLQHLREGERAKLEKAVGSLEELPLYRIQLEVDPDARKVTGRAQILKVAGDKTLTHLYLRVTPNAQGKRVKLSNAALNGQAAVMEQPEPSLYRVKLDPPVAPGLAALVEVRLEATLPEAAAQSATLMGGLTQTQGPRDYGAFSASADALLLTGILPQIPPTGADGEPWEGPSGLGDLASYEPSFVLSSITVPNGWTALTSGAALGEVPQKEGGVRFSYAAAAVRDFPLLIVRGYEKKTAVTGGVDVESWFRKGDEAGGAKALEHTRASLEEMEKRFGPIPWKSLRVVQAPLSGGAGGMEFSGLFVISSALYRALSDPAGGMGLPPGFAALLGGGGGGPNIGKMLEETLEFTVAHEVAHQFFAAMVGSDPVGEPVVDEALAQYAALLYAEWRHGKAAAETTKQQQLISPFHMYRMGGMPDGAAARPTSQFKDSTEYGAIVYGKAPLFFERARKLTGDAAFFKALRAYVDAYRYRWSCSDCFVEVLAKARPEKAKALKALQARWWEEAKGDEDLGKPDMGKLIEQLTGHKLDPQTEAMLQQLLPQLLGQ